LFWFRADEREEKGEEMEDIEDLLAGSGSGTPPGFRLPLAAAVGVGVGVGSRRNKLSSSPSPAIPGTQVGLIIFLILPLSLYFLIHSLFWCCSRRLST